MKILAVDTSTPGCGVAVLENETVRCELSTYLEETHSKRLMEMIRSVFSLSGLSVSDMDGFGVTEGPGSFTGLRIGISTVKGLAMASGKPAVGISTLDALASQVSPSDFLIHPILNAGKNEIYFSRYRFLNGELVKEEEEQVFSIEKAIQGIREPSYFLGEGVIRYQKKIRAILGESAHFASPDQNQIRASAVGFLALKAFDGALLKDPVGLAPRYIRQADIRTGSRLF
ncbi:MAG: tRNA (adenosine(37)-N6)-threonylcarbamoyltransferase complex dimerization subunit type 1 TsaB [Thermodesulfobacteriota bacterium]